MKGNIALLFVKKTDLGQHTHCSVPSCQLWQPVNSKGYLLAKAWRGAIELNQGPGRPGGEFL